MELNKSFLKKQQQEKCFQCGNTCVDLVRICDGQIDCLDDGEDEKHCYDVTFNSTLVKSNY